MEEERKNKNKKILWFQLVGIIFLALILLYINVPKVNTISNNLFDNLKGTTARVIDGGPLIPPPETQPGGFLTGGSGSNFYSIDNPSNFINITEYYSNATSTFFDKAEILAFGYYNESDFLITDYFSKSEILGFNYYNSSDFDISDYFTSGEIIAFNYYNSSDFNISDYVSHLALQGFNYYNSTDFFISDYYNQTQVDSLISGIDLTDYARLDGADFTGDVNLSMQSLKLGETADAILDNATKRAIPFRYYDYDILDDHPFGVAHSRGMVAGSIVPKGHPVISSEDDGRFMIRDRGGGIDIEGTGPTIRQMVTRDTTAGFAFGLFDLLRRRTSTTTGNTISADRSAYVGIFGWMTGGEANTEKFFIQMNPDAKAGIHSGAWANAEYIFGSKEGRQSTHDPANDVYRGLHINLNSRDLGYSFSDFYNEKALYIHDYDVTIRRGKLAIGKHDADYELDVDGDISSQDGSIAVRNSNGDILSSIGRASSNIGGAVTARDYDGVTQALIRGYSVAQAGNTQAYFALGNVAIGKTTADEMLDVDGNIKASGNVTASDFITLSKVADISDGESSLEKLSNMESWVDEKGEIQYNEHYAHVELEMKRIIDYRTETETQEVCSKDFQVVGTKEEIHPETGEKMLVDIQEEVEVCETKEVEFQVPIYETYIQDGLSMETRVAEGEKMKWELLEKIKDILNRLTGAETKITQLEAENDLIKSELCSKDSSYSWCLGGIKQ